MKQPWKQRHLEQQGFAELVTVDPAVTRTGLGGQNAVLASPRCRRLRDALKLFNDNITAWKAIRR
ncbi:hypothetical protein AB0442_40125 [Kitasatospora sp. NPDC085895]|uniref:hypothetical protein n=1 Tax=Kitasatospora sp. NPDC085895 TaxID=3155057 RepID=UPI00344ECFE9